MRNDRVSLLDPSLLSAKQHPRGYPSPFRVQRSRVLTLTSWGACRGSRQRHPLYGEPASGVSMRMSVQRGRLAAPGRARATVREAGSMLPDHASQIPLGQVLPDPVEEDRRIAGHLEVEHHLIDNALAFDGRVRGVSGATPSVRRKSSQISSFSIESFSCWI